MRNLAAWCHDRRRTVHRPLGRRLPPLRRALWATAAGDYVNNFNLPGTESQRAYDLLKDKFPQQSGDTASVVFAVKDGSVLDGEQPPADREGRSREIEKSPEVLAVSDPFAEGAPVSKDGKITFAQIQFRHARRRRRRQAGQDDGRGHAQARRPGRRPGRARRRHHPLVDGRAGRRRGDLRHPRRGARAVPDARRRRDGPAAAQRAVRDGRQPLDHGAWSARGCSTSSTGRRSWRR